MYYLSILQGEFVDDGTETHFEIGNHACCVKAVSSGKQKEGIIHTLLVDGVIMPEASEWQYIYYLGRIRRIYKPRILSWEGFFFVFFFFFEKYVEVSPSSFIKKIEMQYETW